MICHRMTDLQILGIMYDVLYHKNVCNYIIYDIPIKLHKTCRQLSAPFSRYTFVNSEWGGIGGF